MKQSVWLKTVGGSALTLGWLVVASPLWAFPPIGDPEPVEAPPFLDCPAEEVECESEVSLDPYTGYCCTTTTTVSQDQVDGECVYDDTTIEGPECRHVGAGSCNEGLVVSGGISSPEDPCPDRVFEETFRSEGVCLGQECTVTRSRIVQSLVYTPAGPRVVEECVVYEQQTYASYLLSPYPCAD